MKILNYKIMAQIFSSLFVIGATCASDINAMPEGRIFKATHKNINTVSVLDSIRVYTWVTLLAKKISALKDEGYTCKPALSKLWRCTTHLKKLEP